MGRAELKNLNEEKTKKLKEKYEAEYYDVYKEAINAKNLDEKSFRAEVIRNSIKNMSINSEKGELKFAAEEVSDIAKLDYEYDLLVANKIIAELQESHDDFELEQINEEKIQEEGLRLYNEQTEKMVEEAQNKEFLEEKTVLTLDDYDSKINLLGDYDYSERSKKDASVMKTEFINSTEALGRSTLEGIGKVAGTDYELGDMLTKYKRAYELHAEKDYEHRNIFYKIWNRRSNNSEKEFLNYCKERIQKHPAFTDDIKLDDMASVDIKIKSVNVYYQSQEELEFKSQMVKDQAQEDKKFEEAKAKFEENKKKEVEKIKKDREISEPLKEDICKKTYMDHLKDQLIQYGTEKDIDIPTKWINEIAKIQKADQEVADDIARKMQDKLADYAQELNEAELNEQIQKDDFVIIENDEIKENINQVDNQAKENKVEDNQIIKNENNNINQVNDEQPKVNEAERKPVEDDLYLEINGIAVDDKNNDFNIDEDNELNKSFVDYKKSNLMDDEPLEKN